MPIGKYKDFKDCVNQNQDKSDPQAYCGAVQQQIEGKDAISVDSTGTIKIQGDAKIANTIEDFYFNMAAMLKRASEAADQMAKSTRGNIVSDPSKIAQFDMFYNQVIDYHSTNASAIKAAKKQR